MRLRSHLSGRWQDGAGAGTPLLDPVTGEELARASGDGLDLASALDFARAVGGPALRALTFAERAGLLAGIAATLTENRARYADIALRNSGSTAADAAFDIDGGIGTLKYYASLGRKLGDRRALVEPGDEQPTRDENFRALHLWTPVRGVAVHINAFNFPSWGLWEKVAVALLAGVPCLAKPATATAWLSHEMVADVMAAGPLPDGALSLLCGGGRDLMNHLRPGDLVAFTGSADTAERLRAHPNVIRHNIRFAVEADSLNLCCLGPEVTPEHPEFALFIREIVREMTVKAGQKCTAIRRVLVPRDRLDAALSGLTKALGSVVAGDPRDPAVTLGPLVNTAQRAAAEEGLARLRAECRVAWTADTPPGACAFPPTVLVCDAPATAEAAHSVEVFGPLVTLMPYDDTEQAVALALRGGGSLVASLFTRDDDFALEMTLAIAAAHGRVLIVDESIGKSQSGHGVVMPQCVHGGPGRAGGGEELGGPRGLRFYMQRTAVQANRGRIAALTERAATAAL